MNENVNENTVETTETTENVGAEAKTYTEAEVMELLQKEADKRVSSALKKQQAKFEKQLSLSKLDEASRSTAEKDMVISELQAKLAEYEVEKNRSEIKTILGNRGLPVALADVVYIDDDLEASQNRIQTLDTLFKAVVAEEVKKRIASGKPQVGTNSGTIDAVSFRNMSMEERQTLYNTNRELYNRLKG